MGIGPEMIGTELETIRINKKQILKKESVFYFWKIHGT